MRVQYGYNQRIYYPVLFLILKTAMLSVQYMYVAKIFFVKSFK